MVRKILSRLLVCGLVIASTAVLGCKSGGALAGRKNDSGSPHAGPALGSPSKRFGITQSAQPGAEPAAYQAELPIALRSNRSKPQTTCPVDGRAFGAGESPVTVTIQGEPFLVCSNGCAKKAHKEPQKYLSRVRHETSTE